MGQGHDYFHRLARETETEFWINNPTPEEARASLGFGAIGATTNPTYLARLLREDAQFRRGLIDEALRTPLPPDGIFARAHRQAIGRLQAIFMPLYESSRARRGFVAVQGDPRQNDDAAFIAHEALQMRAWGPNIIIKVPSTPAGAEALHHVVRKNIPAIGTLGFSIDQAVYMAEAYRSAIAGAADRPPFYVTFIAGILDEFLAKESRENGQLVAAVAFLHAGCEATRAAYRLFTARGYETRLFGGGARGPHHFTELVGGNLAVTVGFPIAQQIVEADAPIMSRISASAPGDLVQSLMAHLPSYRKAATEGSLSPEEFSRFGPVAGFQKSFLEGVAKIHAAVSAARAPQERRGSA